MSDDLQKIQAKTASMLMEYINNSGVVRGEDLSEKVGINDSEVSNFLEVTDQMMQFKRLMVYYQCAIAEVVTKLEVLNKELSLVRNRNPFESIKSRIKSPASIFEKLRRRGIAFSVENIEANLTDVAGVRVICSFIDDIYMLRDCLVQQDDIKLILEKDYIKTPKENGYRSLHLIVEIPIFLTNEKKPVQVEVQFRTIAMDFWASLEHKIKYKQDIPGGETIAEELKYSAELINQLDKRMQQIRSRIDEAKGEKQEIISI